MGKVLKLRNWAGLAMLSLGVGVVQLSAANSNQPTLESGTSDRFRGFVVILMAAALSSMAGVYFEKILKGVRVSLWTRNLQLAAYSVLTAALPLCISGDVWKLQERGFFYG